MLSHLTLFRSAFGALHDIQTTTPTPCGRPSAAWEIVIQRAPSSVESWRSGRDAKAFQTNGFKQENHFESDEMKPILLTAAGNLDNQDRGLIVPLDGRLVVCVADGVGGRSGGTEAANMAVELVRQNADRLANADVCAELLRTIDSEMSKVRYPSGALPDDVTIILGRI